MRDKRPVDELSVDELERVLAIKRREERMQVMERMQRSGRVVEVVDMPPVETTAAEAAMPAPAHDPVAAALASLTQPVMRESAPPVEAAPRFDEVAENHRQTNPKARRKVMDRFLLGIEILAVLLIGVIGVNLFQAITRLDEETAQAQALADEQRRLTIPTIAPTPTIRLENVVLPGGHTYGSNPQFNVEEIPAALRPLVQSEWVQPVLNRPAPTSETALALIIPKLNLNATIVPGVDWEALKQGVGQVLNGVNPGDDYGNVSFAAHNDIYGKLFQHLDQLEPGDTFQIQTRTSVFTYSVTDKLFVEPTQVEVLQPRQGATATLISCYPYQVNNQRIIIFADRIS
ncbi:MAG: sortase [Anaerolineae bacterium]|nr:sortase [Anaerolineae bacterium]